MERGARLAAIVRPGRDGSRLEREGIEIRRANLDEPGSLGGVFDGIGTLIHLSGMAQATGIAVRARGTGSVLHARFAAGETVEIAGYRMAPALVAGLGNAELAPPATPARIAWLEVASGDDASVAPVSAARIHAWRAQGHDASGHAVNGLPFWQTQEIAEADALVAALSRSSRRPLSGDQSRPTLLSRGRERGRARRLDRPG